MMSRISEKGRRTSRKKKTRKGLNVKAKEKKKVPVIREPRIAEGGRFKGLSEETSWK